MPLKSTTTTTQPPKWEEIREAIKAKDKKKIKALGEKFNRPRLVQEGVKVEEIQEQLNTLGPEGHILVGPLLLDLAAKL